MEDNIKILTDYLDKNGTSYTIDLNPSPEKIKRIEKSIKRNEQIERISIECYKRKK